MQVYKTAIVTGASSGIGARCASSLARAGFRVCLIARRKDRLDGVTKAICQAEGGQAAIAVVADVTRPQDRSRVLERCLTLWERIDLLVNNAGYALGGAVEELDCEAVRQEFEVNCFAYLTWMQDVAGRMICQPHGGRIINVGSVSGLVAFPALGAYAASKYAVEAFSDAARRELRPFGVQVVLVEPGSVVSEIWRKADALSHALKVDWRQSRYRALYEAELEHADRMRRGRGPSPDVVARAVVKAATARRPKPRYYVTAEAKLAAMLAKMPTRVQDWILRRVLP